MSASFAHELSQPLGAIALNVDTALRLSKEAAGEPKRLIEALADIQQANEHALDIMRHMRGLLKRRDADEVREVDLNAVTAETLHILSPEANKRNVSLSTNYATAPLPVLADPVQLQQAILNVALNGMDAMTDTEAGARAMVIETALLAKDRAEVSVSDTGKGIPEGHFSQVFETFYTTKPEGTGLGLSITRHIVETYGGRIWAEHREGGGTIFRVTLPLVRPMQ
jgi:signal transduction histidine kinase